MNDSRRKAIVDGILTGGVYALMAAGLTLIFGVMDIINIAQGALVVLGAYLSYVLSAHLGIDLFVGLIITIPAFFVLGVAIEWAFMRRLREHDRTAMSILVTYAVAIIIEGILSVIFGVELRAAARRPTSTARSTCSASTCPTSTCSASCWRSCCWALCTTCCTGPIRPRRARVAAEPHRGRADRHRTSTACARSSVGHRRGGHRGRRHGVRRHQRVQPRAAATT